MADVTLTLSDDDIKAAVRLWLRTQGYEATDTLSVSIRHVPGDRPFDSDTTTATVTGVALARDPRMSNAQFDR